MVTEKNYETYIEAYWVRKFLAYEKASTTGRAETPIFYIIQVGEGQVQR